jgi:hypothetical protein
MNPPVAEAEIGGAEMADPLTLPLLIILILITR